MWCEESEWTSLAWMVGGRTPVGIAARPLQIGTGGWYPFGETWGPRHPDAWAHNWKLEGRSLTNYHPDVPDAEDSPHFGAQRHRTEDYLFAALAARSRGTLSIEQATERLRVGGQKYRDFLHVGSACIARALNCARRDVEGPDRLPLREAIDALERRREAADWVVDLAHTTSPARTRTE
ncbi:hypothetical protein ABZ446_42480 [Streptomyces sp. NPDC005813]|uniref:hypothetical protein n=1 Tax=Streptomyces sp. NPDC005813 TaxID=3155592 RepID=UPI0033FC8ED4